jgi:putative addiction module antidote
MQLKVRKIGNAYGVLLPKQVIDRLKLIEGSQLMLTDTEDGVRLTPYDADFNVQLEAFRKTEPKHRNSYRELAK